MWRVGLAGLAALFALAAPARAATPTISTALSAGVTPSFVSSQTRPKSGVGPIIIGDGFGLNPPTLLSAPGQTVTVTLDAPVDAIRVSLARTFLTPVPAGPLTYTVTLPADAPLPGQLSVGLDWSTDTELTTAGWIANLDAVPPPPPPPPPPPQPATPQPEPPAAVTAARLSGRRLAVTVACPAAAQSGCAGVVTLRTATARVARLRFTLAAGTVRTLRAKVSRRVAKQLRRGRQIRSELVSPGRPVVRGRLHAR